MVHVGSLPERQHVVLASFWSVGAETRQERNERIQVRIIDAAFTAKKMLLRGQSENNAWTAGKSTLTETEYAWTKLIMVFFSMTTSRWGLFSPVVLLTRSKGTWIQIWHNDRQKVHLRETEGMEGIYNLCKVPWRNRNARPQLPSLGEPIRAWYPSQHYTLSEYIICSHLSYAVDVLKDITKPSTVPSTVNIWFEIARDVVVSSETSATTELPKVNTLINDGI
jgi:hypothetical protein